MTAFRAELGPEPQPAVEPSAPEPEPAPALEDPIDSNAAAEQTPPAADAPAADAPAAGEEAAPVALSDIPLPATELASACSWDRPAAAAAP